MSTTRNLNRNQWCDYCKLQWGVGHPDRKGEKPAVWVVKSKSQRARVSVRHYCQECMLQLEAWHDGSKWSMDDQVNYALGVKEIDYGVEPK